jgi:hypothetical protein
VNTPQLQSAYELDNALKSWGDEIKSALADQNTEMDITQYKQI